MKIFHFLLITALLGTSFVYSQNPINKERSNQLKNPSAITVSWAKRIKQGCDFRVWMSNQMTLGLEAWDGDPPDRYGLEYPNGSGIEHLYGAAPRIGAIIDSAFRVTEGYNGWDARKEILPEYSHRWREHFWRTVVGSNDFDVLGYNGYYFNNAIIVNREGVDDDFDGRIDEDELDGLDGDGDWNILTDDIGSDGLPDSLEITCDGRPYDPILHTDPADDNYLPTGRDSCHPYFEGIYPLKNNPDFYTEKNGLPDHGEPHVDEDYGAISHSDLYCSATDTFKRPTISGHVPMGVKVFQKSLAWKGHTGANTILPLEYSFINVGQKQWQDAYIGFFADPDIGPAILSGYYQHNYAAYDTATRTGYVHNPIDIGSTPLGVVLLGASKPLDSLEVIFKWADFTTRGHIDPGTNDSIIYKWMTTNPDDTTKGDPNKLSDVRINFALGKFQMQQFDTAKAVFALVSGRNIEEMLKNARKAQLIYDCGGFVMPLVHIADSGSGKSIRLYWKDIERSPFGLVTSYRVYHGTSSGQYTDSVTTSDLTITYTDLPAGMIHYFVVAAFDDKGNRSPNSEEVSSAPQVPLGLVVTGMQTSIFLEWQENSDIDIYGYNVYRKSSVEASFTKMNSEIITQTSYLDTAVWGDKIYYYSITAVDSDGHESSYSDFKGSRLIPPATPQRFMVIRRPDHFYLTWMPNSEADLVGYNIYRTEHRSDSIKLNSSIWTQTEYYDSVPASSPGYCYRIYAIDNTDAISTPTDWRCGYSITEKDSILVIHLEPYYMYPIPPDSAPIYFLMNLLKGYKYKIVRYYPFTNIFCDDWEYLNDYSTVLLMFDDPSLLSQYTLYCYPIKLKKYLLASGNLLIMGRSFTNWGYPNFYQFIEDVFGINQMSEISNEENFFGAYGSFDFPEVMIDTAKIASTSKRLSTIERFANIPPERIMYTYRTDPFDPSMEGDPIGIRAVDTSLKAYYFSFPLYYLEYSSAKAMITKILDNFGEVMSVRTVDNTIPTSYQLYNAYPNPFNPSTKIQFDLPTESKVLLRVYNTLGQEVARLIEEQKPAGKYEVDWNASALGGGVSSGIYFYRFEASSIGTGSVSQHLETKKVILLK